MHLEDCLLKIIGNINTLGDSPCFISRDVFYTYHDVKKRLLQIVTSLSNIQTPFNTLGIITGDDFDTYCALLASIYLHKTYVPINRKNPVKRNLDIIQEAAVSVIFCSDDKMYAELKHQLYDGCVLLNSKDIYENSSISDLIQTEYISSLTAYILFTSGSTGKPKGVPITYGNINCFVGKAVTDPLFSYSSGDRFIQMFELSFDPSVFSILVPLYFGAQFFIVPDSGIIFHHVFNFLEDHKITVALLTPSVINFLRPHFKEINVPSLRYSMFCGEALHISVASEWQTCAPNATIHNWYGPTEATVICLQYSLNANTVNGVNDIVPIGKPLKNISTILLDSKDNIIYEKNVEGELCIFGDQVINSYWQNEKANTQSFFLHPAHQISFYRTGDICFLDTNNDYQYIGRKDFQVKINGYRMELAEIEHHAREVDFVNQAIVLKKNDQQLVIFIESSNEGFTENSLITALKKALPWYMIPTTVIIVPQMPYNHSMKIDRNKLRELIS